MEKNSSDPTPGRAGNPARRTRDSMAATSDHLHRLLRLPLLVSAVLLYCRITESAQVPGIVSQADLDAQYAALQTAGGSRQACQVVFRPYATWGPPGYDNPAAANLPTPSKPAAYVAAALTFDVVNLGSEDIPPGWNFSLTNSFYTRIDQATNLHLVSFGDDTLQGYSNSSGLPLGANAGNNVTAGFVVRASTNMFLPDTFCIGDLKCSIVLVNNISGTYLPFEQAEQGGAGIESAEQPISLQGGEFYDVNGNQMTLKCANWFGFNNGNLMLDGLWAGNSALVNDFATVMYRIQLLGFNCFRVPFSFQTLFNQAPFTWANANCTPISSAGIRANTLQPGYTSNNPLPPQAKPEGNNATICNEKLPNDSVYKRFLYIVQFMAYNNFYVLIDDHSEDSTVKYNTGQWPSLWASLVKDLVADPKVANRLMVDILNEPDSFSYTWNDLKGLYISAMDAIYAVSPNTPMLIEGTTAHTGQYTGINWGDGFATTGAYLQLTGLSDPRPFFDILYNKPYLNNVALAPHMYPPSITNSYTGISGNDLWNRLYYSFGILRTIGYPPEDNSRPKHKFPILIGEIGTFFDVPKATCCDLPFMRDALAWLQGQPNTGQAHPAIQNVAWWAWNANTGDTGGLVDNTWVNILWIKIDWMRSATGMTPCPSPTPTPASGGIQCVASLSIASSWPYNGAYESSINVNLQNLGSATVTSPYTVTMTLASYSSLPQFWNWAVCHSKMAS
ncbi:hypothetical protein WJX73_010697 [Symbiochloris irregularis]|uniref:Glycoside hydrolase family 5 domain-containing protein n=1 Tax=Symbiochloris irregularis TaxID=706552 RepID=A0AAW1PQP0_9CHLO